MNDELKKQALDLLATMLKDATNIREFTISQAPEIVQQYLSLQFWISAISCFTPIFLACSVFMISKLTKLYAKKASFDNDPIGKILTWFIIGFLILLIFPLVVSENLDWLKIIIAPKAYLLMQAAGK